MSESHSGHCLCGAIGYRAEGAPLWVAFCHCRDCRLATGGVIAAYAGFRRRDFHFTGQEPAAFASSPGVTRRFCGNCGTPLTYESEKWAEEIHLLLGSAEDIEAYKPQAHVFTAEQVPWLHCEDGLPRFAKVPSAAASDER